MLAGAATSVAGAQSFNDQSFNDQSLNDQAAAARAGVSVPPAELQPQPTEPVEVAPPPQPGPRVFGYAPVALGPTRTDHRWLNAAGLATPVSPGPWDELLQRAGSLPLRARAMAVNVWANHNIRFSADADTWGVRDRWSRLEETVARGGDCEDFALAKMRLLAATGVSPRDLYLVLVRDERKGQDHAVLVVRDEGELYVLDSANDRVASAEDTLGYRPVLSFSEGGRWTFGKPAVGGGGTLSAAAMSR